MSAPVRSGSVRRAGVDLGWQEFGTGRHAVMLLPPWNIIHSQTWKLVVAGLEPHFRVITSDPPGNGRSSPSSDPARFAPAALAADALAVLDDAAVDRAVLVGHSLASQALLVLAAEHHDRVAGAVFLAPFLPYTRSLFPRALTSPAVKAMFDVPFPAPRGWARMNASYIRRHRTEFERWFVGKVLTTPHSELGIDDSLSWAAEGDLESLLASLRAPVLRDRKQLRRLAGRVSCPVLVVHGTRDAVTPVADGRWLAHASGGRFAAIDGGDHAPHARPAIGTTLEIRAFASEAFEQPLRVPPTTGSRPGRKRVLVVSSPIGLGHARRDLAIVRALREERPGVEVQWLAQDPVTNVLEAYGESVHPASALLRSECRHFELESVGHQLDVFGAFRRADTLVAHNFMVFRDVLATEHFDAVVADEAWEIDHYLHEHPSEKRAPFVWLTDFVGVLPTPETTERDARLIADANALMIEHRHTDRAVRDLSLFVGNEADLLQEPLGPGLPTIRDWALGEFTCTGYFGAHRYSDEARHEVRTANGWSTDQPLLVVAVGGSGVGQALLERAVEAHRAARRVVGDLRTVVVTGPRITSRGPEVTGLERRGYVPDLDKVLAAADFALVQGGLATAMELTANQTPFAYVPLERHFEQQLHVPYRLANYGAGTRIDYQDAVADNLAAVVAAGIGTHPGVRPVERDGHRRAAQAISALF